MREKWGPRAHPARCCDEWGKRSPQQAEAHERRRWREYLPWLVALGFFFAWALGGGP